MEPQTKKCPMCAEEIPLDAALCPYCGTPWGSEPTPPAAPAPPAQVIKQQFQASPPPPKKNSWIGWAIGGMVVLVLVAIVVVGLLLSQGRFNLPGAVAPATPTRTPRPSSTPNYAATSQASSSSLPAQELNVHCSDFNYSPVYINEDQPIKLYFLWGTATEEYRQDYINAASFSLLVDGQDMDISSADLAMESCYDGFCARWWFPELTLEKREHKVELTVKLDRQVTDGYDLDQNGELDTYGPGDVSPGPCIIVVNAFNDMDDWVNNFAAPIVTDLADNDLPANAEDFFDDPGASYANWGYITSGVSFTDGNMHFVANGTAEWAGGAVNSVNFLVAYQFVPRVIGEETWVDLIFRASDTTWYSIGIRPNDGYWSIALRREDGSYDGLSEGYTNPVQVDQEVYVVAVVQGNMMGFFIDNQPAGYANNFELYTDWVDFSVYSADYAVVDVQFVRLWDLNNLLR